MIALRFESTLNTDAATVWQQVSRMSGVNRELMPLLRMTAPPAYADLSLEQAPLGEVLFQSWLLLFGLLPFDRHALRLERLLPGVGFDEDSTSLLQRVWRHRRRVQATAGGCRVVDELEVLPRLAPAFIVRALVRTVFMHRHRRLRRMFGAAAS